MCIYIYTYIYIYIYRERERYDTYIYIYTCIIMFLPPDQSVPGVPDPRGKNLPASLRVLVQARSATHDNTIQTC